MGLCTTCSKRAQTSKHGKAGIYLDHVTEVTQYIKENFPNLKIIVWDDMLRSIDLHVLQGTTLAASTCTFSEYIYDFRVLLGYFS